MSEIRASQAREITNNNEEWSAELWYSKHEEKIFKMIQQKALNGKFDLMLNRLQWDNNDHNKKYLKLRFNSLGYKVSENEDGSSLYISW